MNKIDHLISRPGADVQKQSLRHLIKETLRQDEQIRHIMNLSIDHLSVDVITYAVDLFRANMRGVNIPDQSLVDLCGTGGDKSGSFNISTTAAFVVAGAGIPVAKHGNVSITSKSGSMDVLKALGVWLPQKVNEAKAQFEQTGICFLFAPYFHPVFSHFSAARKELATQGQRTIFNILGPLLNPARVKHSIMGVFRADFVEPLAQVMLQTGTQKGLVFCGAGLDELSLAGLNTIAEIKNNAITLYTKEASDFGFSGCVLEDLQGGTPEENAAITHSILSAAENGPKTDIVLLNAGAAIYVAREDLTMQEAIVMARESIASGAAQRKLEACQHEHS